MWDIEEKINGSVFPGLQGGPHNHTITALSVALKQAQTQEFKAYQEQVMKNAKALGESLSGQGFDLVSGGTDNHLLLMDLTKRGVNGNKAELICEQCSIILNKNTVPGDKSALNPSGLRVGTPAMTSRGLVESDFLKVGDYLSRAVKITQDIQTVSGKKLSDFKKVMNENPPGSMLELKQEVEQFSSRFELPGSA
jgi:glycine hydroxymethyltransferase